MTPLTCAAGGAADLDGNSAAGDSGATGRALSRADDGAMLEEGGAADGRVVAATGGSAFGATTVDPEGCLRRIARQIQSANCLPEPGARNPDGVTGEFHPTGGAGDGDGVRGRFVGATAVAIFSTA